MEPTIYYDQSTPYLELHAMRAPVGGYLPGFQDSATEYDMEVAACIEDFEMEFDVDVIQLGRSGRHICIEDTPQNRARYDMLRTEAIARTRAMWAEMREPNAR